MTEKEMEKEQSQEQLRANEVHSKPIEEDTHSAEDITESTPQPENHPPQDNGNGEVTLRDVVEVLRKGFSSLSDKLDKGFSTLSDKLDTVSGKLDTVSGKLNSIENVLKGMKSSIGMLRGEISEWALLDTVVDYLREKEGKKEFVIRRVPRTGKRGADWILETEKRYYIIETKTYLDDKIFRKAVSQIGNEAKRLKGNKEIWGIVAARFSEVRPGPILLKFKHKDVRRTVPIYVFSYDIGAEKFRFSKE